MNPTSVMGKRITAYIIDAIIGIVIAVLGFFALAQTVSSPVDLCGIDDAPTFCFFGGDTVYFADGGRALAVLLISVGGWLAMGWLLQGLVGGTPGKLMLGLRVVKQETGELAGLTKCLLRTLMWIVDGQPFGFPLVGFITGLSTKGHRRVGDMAAKTLVIAKGNVGVPPVVPGLTHPIAAGGPAPGVANGDGVTGPKWDSVRNAYIQWDPELSAWMQFDDASRQWIPITQ